MSACTFTRMTPENSSNKLAQTEHSKENGHNEEQHMERAFLGNHEEETENVSTQLKKFMESKAFSDSFKKQMLNLYSSAEAHEATQHFLDSYFNNEHNVERVRDYVTMVVEPEYNGLRRTTTNWRNGFVLVLIFFIVCAGIAFIYAQRNVKSTNNWFNQIDSKVNSVINAFNQHSKDLKKVVFSQQEVETPSAVNMEEIGERIKDAVDKALKGSEKVAEKITSISKTDGLKDATNFVKSMANVKDMNELKQWW